MGVSLWPPRTPEDWELAAGIAVVLVCVLVLAWLVLPPLPDWPWCRRRSPRRHSLEDAGKGTRRIRPDQYR